MIYQCYHAPGQSESLFDGPVYCGFGLEPFVNPDIARNCPELEDPSARRALTEYGAMLHLWRNPPDNGDAWIGFTSYRQQRKTPFRFQSKRQVGFALWCHDIAGWWACDVRGVRFGVLHGAAAQAESAHPGIMAVLNRLGDVFDFEIPARFYSDRYVLYANYWVMRKTLFDSYMNWSWPKVDWCLRHRNDDSFLSNLCPADAAAAALTDSEVHGKAVGYVMERLFIIWYMLHGLRVRRLGPTFRL